MCYRDFLFFITICKYMPVYKQDLHGSWTGIGQDCPQTVDIFFLFLDLLRNIGKEFPADQDLFPYLPKFSYKHGITVE